PGCEYGRRPQALAPGTDTAALAWPLRGRCEWSKKSGDSTQASVRRERAGWDGRGKSAFPGPGHLTGKLRPGAGITGINRLKVRSELALPCPRPSTGCTTAAGE